MLIVILILILILTPIPLLLLILNIDLLSIFLGAFSGAEDLFSTLFGGGGHPFASFFGGGGRRRKMRGQDIMHPLKVSLEDLYNGKKAKLQLSKRAVCSACHGCAFYVLRIAYSK